MRELTTIITNSVVDPGNPTLEATRVSDWLSPADIERLAASIADSFTMRLRFVPLSKLSKDKRTLDNTLAVRGRGGGYARAAALSSERRSEIARQAADARWRSQS
jgi:hypothetical protein